MLCVSRTSGFIRKIPSSCLLPDSLTEPLPTFLVREKDTFGYYFFVSQSGLMASVESGLLRKRLPRRAVALHRFAIECFVFSTIMEYSLRKECDMRSINPSAVELLLAYAHLTVTQQVSAMGSFTSDLVADEHIWPGELPDLRVRAGVQGDHSKASGHRPLRGPTVEHAFGRLSEHIERLWGDKYGYND